MTGRRKILSLGAMGSPVDAALAEDFEVYCDAALGLDTIIAEHGPEIAAIVTRGRVPVTAALLERLPKLEIIANFGVGYDSVDAVAGAKRGVVVTNTPDVLNDEVADFTIGLLLATIRRLPQADRHVRSGKWAERQSFPLSATLRGRSIGIVGMGRIGKAIARRLEGFDLSVAYHGRHRQPDVGYAYYPELKALAAAVDTLIVVLPGGAATRNIIDAGILAALGAEGVLINVARGSVVDEAALIAALGSGTILAAGLDVFAREPEVPPALLQMEQVVLLPHIGSATHHTRGLMGQLVVRNVVSWFAGTGAVTPVPESVAGLGHNPRRTG
jgi:lactate dehydrogenase-like 2-hydroxyacid dehydrogenase